MTLAELVAVLLAACIAVPVFRRFGFGSVLGYLAAGIALGPYGLGLVDDIEEILHMAEFGVVLLLFIIGLELKPARLWVMRKSVFGLGTDQVLVTSLAIGAFAYWLGVGISTALVIGLGLALSSTAFVLQILAEKKELNAAHGRASFAILLFQDLAVIPILALIPLLGSPAGPTDSVLLQAFISVAAIAFLVIGGRYLLRPAFRYVAAVGGQEIFTAATLLLVVGAAYLMYVAGISMALGAFLAGVLLADSEFRHQLEAEIDPFKGLLLGLFFVAVGMSANLSLLIEEPLVLLASTAGLLLLKTAVLFGLGRLFGLGGDSPARIALTLPQGGEFAFVIFGAAVTAGVMARDLADLLIMVVTMTMLLTPFLFTVGERISATGTPGEQEREFDAIEEKDHDVVIAGMGRFGQILARILHIRRIPFTAIESNAAQVDFIRHFNASVYYGDVNNLDLLRAARVEHARIFVVALPDVTESIRVVTLVREHFPDVKIYARARNRHHAQLLINLKVDYLIREALVSSLEMAEEMLRALGDTEEIAEMTVQRFRTADERLLVREAAILQDEKTVIQSAEAGWRELEDLFDADELRAARHERGNNHPSS
jgi:glutathione-regulated potassium-efflux system ancillary protein KefC/glutathione-regulated potassium-efflux system protein KefB